MAFPVVAATNTSSTNTAGTDHVVALPVGVTAGDLILICMNIGSTAATLNAHADYTELLDENSAVGLKILYRWATGGETNPTLVSSASTKDATVTLRIGGAQNPATQPPRIGTTSTGSSTTPDPPASAAPGSTQDYLFVTFCGSAGEQADDGTYCTGFPTNYSTNNLQKTSGTAGTNVGAMIALATRSLNTGSAQDPGTFTVSENNTWRAQTIVIDPGPQPPFKLPSLPNSRTPQSAAYSIACNSLFFVNLALTLFGAAPPNTTDIFPAPLYTPRIVTKQTQDTRHQNLLVTTLAPQIPPGKYSQEIPVRRIYRIPDVVENIHLTTLAPKIPPGIQIPAQPIRKIGAVHQDSQNLLETLLAAAVAPPLDDLLKSRRVESRPYWIRQQPAFQTLNLLPTLLSTPAAPLDELLRCRQVESRPRWIPRQQAFQPLNLTINLPVPGFSDFSRLPLVGSQPSRRIARIQTDIPINLIVLYSEQFSDFPRLPLFASQPGRRIKPVKEIGPPNLLTSTLVSAVNTTDVFRELQLVRIPRRIPRNPSQSGENTLRLLTATNPKPFHQDEWPNPKRRVHQNPVQPDGSMAATILQTLFIHRATVTSSFQSRPKPRIQITEPANTSNLLATANPRPFHQDDWPNPIGKRRNPQFDHINTIYVVINPKPIHQDDWPNPIRRQYLAPIDGIPNPILTVMSDTPFRQSDWPNPIGKRENRQFIDLNTIALISQQNPIPFHQDDWQLQARRRHRTPQFDVPNTLGMLIIPNVVPFHQTDWPNPSGYIQKQRAQQRYQDYYPRPVPDLRTLVTGIITDPAGNPATSGYVLFTLKGGLHEEQNYRVTGTTIILNKTVSVPINPDGSIFVWLWGNDLITPTGSWYKVTFVPNGRIHQVTNFVYIHGATYDITNPEFI